MLEPPTPEDEAQRVAALRALNVLDTPPEERFERITRLAARLFNVPIALISLIDTERQWFKSCHGLTVSETPRSLSFCGHAILGESTLVVPDTRNDSRFADNPLVTGEPHIRFYAGAPLTDAGGYKLGTLCIIDRRPRRLPEAQLHLLYDLARLAEGELCSTELGRALLRQRESEERTRAVLNTVVDGILIIDEHGVIESINPAVGLMFRYPDDELIGKSAKLLFPEESWRSYEQYFERYKKAGGAEIIGVDGEVKGLRHDGSLLRMEIGINEIRHGERRRFTVVVRDVTMRWQIRRELRDTLSFQRTILDAADYSIISTDPAGVIRTLNKAAKKWLGYQAEELVGIETPARIHDSGELDRRARELTEELGRQIEPGFEVVVAKARNGVTDENEWTYTRKDGTQFPVLLSVAPLNDANGDLAGFLCIGSDITERKRAAEALAQEEEKSRLLLESAGEGIYGIDRGGHTTFVNPAAARMLGYASAELIGRPMHTLVHHSYADGSPYPDTKCPVYAAVTYGKVQYVTEEVLWRKDGSCFPVEYSSTPMRKDGNIVGAVVTFRDVTGQKKVERLKNEFVSVVSHELRTPLTSIRGSLGLIAGGVAGELPDKVRQLVDIAHKNSERLGHLINDILDVEKIESGKMVFQIKPLELAPLLQQSIEVNQPYAQEFGTRLTFVDRMPNVWVAGDPDRLMQVMANLLSNAAKFSPSGEEVTVSMRRVGGAIRVAVVDRGPGIPLEFHSRIFGKFAQADASDSRRKGGTGLGLSIVKAIVERFGGKIAFESAPERGTVFYFDLPELSDAETAAGSVVGENPEDES